MKKIQYNGQSKILNGICTKINAIIDSLITDVKVNNTSVVTDHVANITMPTKVSDLENDSHFIDNTVNNLVNYYTETEVDDLISHVAGMHFEVVQTLPVEGDTNTIYLVPKQDSGLQDVYEEWIYIVEEAPLQSHWELIGSTDIDLSNYIQKSQTSGLVKNDGTIDTTQYAPMSDIPTVNNATLTIQKNGTNVQTFTANASADKTANITVPVTQSDLTEVRLTNEDLNDVTYPGFYFAACGNTVTNKPTGYNNFGLVVIHNASQSQYTQIISNENGSYRRIKKSNGTWTSWALDNFTDEKVKQSPFASPIPNANYPVLIANSANGTEESGAVWKNTNITYNPSTNTFNVSNGTVKAYTGQYSELVSTFIGLMAQNTLLAYFSPNPNQASGTIVEAVMPATSGTLALQSELPTEAVEWKHQNLLGAKNLFSYPYNNIIGASRGVNYELQADGSYYLHGTNNNQTSNSYIYLVGSAWKDEMTINKNMKIRWEGTGTGLENVTLNITKRTGSSGSRTNVTYLAKDTDFELIPESDTKYDFQFSVTKLTSVDAYVFPMMRYADIVDAEYMPPSRSNRELTVGKVDVTEIAPLEQSNIASQTYAVGDYMFWYCGFYRVTAAITSGGTISTSNVTKTTLGAELKRALT